MRHHELTDQEWAVIEPLLPQNSRGVARVDDRLEIWKNQPKRRSMIRVTRSRLVPCGRRRIAASAGLSVSEFPRTGSLRWRLSAQTGCRTDP